MTRIIKISSMALIMAIVEAHKIIRCSKIFQDFLFVHAIPVNILYKSTAGRYRPVSYPDGPITARCRFIKNASWDGSYCNTTLISFHVGQQVTQILRACVCACACVRVIYMAIVDVVLYCCTI